MTKKHKRAQKQRTIIFAAAGTLIFAITWMIFSGGATPAAEGSLPPETTTQNAYQKYQEGAFVLDVRTPAKNGSIIMPQIPPSYL